MIMPKPYAVYVSGMDERGKKFFLRCGPASSIQDAKELISSEIRSCRETFGGMIEPALNKKRQYHIFKATWEEVKS
jgi:hypothetical protein